MRKGKRGQAAITDLFIAISVCVILITVTTLSWELYNIRLNSRLDFDDMVIKGFIITDTLVKSPGIPNNWEENPTTVVKIGLAEKDRTIDEEKLLAFIGLTEDQIKNNFQIGLYNIYFIIKNVNGTAIVDKGSTPTGSITINLARIVMYKGEPKVMEFALWK